MLAQVQEGWEAFAEDGTPRWTVAARDESHLADDRYLALREGGKVRLIELASGKEKWSLELGEAGATAKSDPLALLLRDVLILREDTRLKAVSLQDGQVRWEAAVATAMRGNVAAPWEGGVAFGGLRLSLQDGKELGKAPNVGFDRCTPPLVLGDFAITGHGSAVQSDTKLVRSKLDVYGAYRLPCNSNAAAANGLVYGFASDCMCSASHMRGFSAHGAASSTGPTPDFAAERPVTSVPRAGELLPAAAETDWPMYRQNVRRSASVACTPVQAPRELWKTQVCEAMPEGAVAASRRAGDLLGISGLTSAAGLVFVADGGRGRLTALDARTGAVRWRAMAGGGVDSAPTYAKGYVVFGSRDGFVYCLNARDGALLWSAQAAPGPAMMPAYGQLESRWPVVGSVTVDGETVYATAGRSTAADGGIALCAFELATGKTLWARAVTPVRGRAGGSPYNDVVIGGPSELRFAGSAVTKSPPGPAKSVLPANSDTLVPAVEGLVHHTRMTEESALHGYVWVPMLYGGVRARNLAWSREVVFGFGRHDYSQVNNSYAAMMDKSLQVFAARAATESPAAPNLPARGLKEMFYGPENLWTVDMPAGAHGAAFIITGQVAVAGVNVGPGEKRTGLVMMLDLASGRKLGAQGFEAPLCHDGLIATEGRLFVACQDGTVCGVGR